MIQGALLIVSAPSGAGKTSLVTALCQRMSGISVSVSHTTRPPREGEVDGCDYYFVSHEQFSERRLGGDFLEDAQVFDNYYGTSRSALQSLLDAGEDVILEIDWQGARQVREQMPLAQSLFILPPSREVLERRLRARGQDSEAVIQRRMRDAQREMSHYGEYDYLIINDDFEQALSEMVTLFSAQRLRTGRQSALQRSLIAQLTGD